MGTILLFVKGAVIGVSANCNSLLDDHLDDLLEDCPSKDIDEKVCKNLELKFENDDEDNAFGGEYEYRGTVKLNDDNLRPFYEQKHHGPSRGPIYMYHNGENLVGKSNTQKKIGSFDSAKCKKFFEKEMDFEDFESCSGRGLAQDPAGIASGSGKFMEITVTCNDGSGIGTAGIIGIIIAIIVIIAIVILVILVVRKRRQHRESIGMHATSQL